MTGRLVFYEVGLRGVRDASQHGERVDVVVCAAAQALCMRHASRCPSSMFVYTSPLSLHCTTEHDVGDTLIANALHLHSLQFWGVWRSATWPSSTLAIADFHFHISIVTTTSNFKSYPNPPLYPLTLSLTLARTLALSCRIDLARLLHLTVQHGRGPVGQRTQPT